MDVTQILKNLTGDDTIAEIAKKASASKEDVSAVITKATELLGGAKDGLKLDSSKITELTGKLLSGKSGKELLSQLLGEEGESKLAKLTGLKSDSVKNILSAASEKLGDLKDGNSLLESGLKDLAGNGLKGLGGLFK